MKIIEIETNRILYDSEGEEEFFVTSSFFWALKAGEIKYMAGGLLKGKRYSEIKILDLKDKEFDSVFRGIALSETGKLVMKGKMTVDTVL